MNCENLVSKFLVVLIAVLAGTSVLFAQVPDNNNTDETDEYEGHDFLFLTEDAYTQDEGQWQLSFTSQYMDGKESKEVENEGGESEITKTKLKQWTWAAEVEYGITDWLQFEVEVPFSHVNRRTSTQEDDAITVSNSGTEGIGDIETGIKIKLADENKNDLLGHTASLGFSVTWPTGDWKQDMGTDKFGWEISSSISKTMEKWAYHFSGSFGMTNNAREYGETATTDVREFGLGAAIAYMAAERLTFIFETSAEWEYEGSTGNESASHETELYLTPGVAYELIDDLEVGVGIPLGATADSYDWGIIAKIQYEW